MVFATQSTMKFVKQFNMDISRTPFSVHPHVTLQIPLGIALWKTTKPQYQRSRHLKKPVTDLMLTVSVDKEPPLVVV